MSYLYQKLSEPSCHVLAFVSNGVLEKLNIKYECISPPSSGYWIPIVRNNGRM